MRQVYGPDTGRCFGGTGETDIEHIRPPMEVMECALGHPPAPKAPRPPADLGAEVAPSR